VAAAQSEGLRDLARLGGEWAPLSPGVQLEVARITRDPLALLRSFGALHASFPSLAWLLTVGLGALGLGSLLAAAVITALGFVRAVSLLGHSIGHSVWSQPPAAWPGALALGSALAVLPVLGAGPMLVAAALGALAIPYLDRTKALAVLAALLLAGTALGPPLERWAALATLPASSPGLLAAWRVERGQPLPGDIALLEERLGRGVGSPVERIALAAGLKRQGDLEGAEALIEGAPPVGSRGLRASAASLLATVRLARGDVRRGIEAFSEARGYEESAAVLYNLSQAHGRALNLTEQSRLFGAARAMDPDLVTEAVAGARPDVHRFFLDVPSPISAYLSEGLAAAPESALLASDVRRRALGIASIPHGWILVPGLAALGLLLRARGVRSCSVCLRTACERCGTVAEEDETCVRCRRIEESDDSVDPRIRRLERDRDRALRRASSRALALLSVALPGSADILRGRLWHGSFALWSALVGGAALYSARLAWEPFEVGRLAAILPILAALVLLGPAYLAGLLGALSRVGGARAVR
jgi:hypothetical protein